MSAHGTISSYTNHKCRCPECTAAIRDYVRQWRAARRPAPPATRPPPADPADCTPVPVWMWRSMSWHAKDRLHARRVAAVKAAHAAHDYRYRPDLTIRREAS